MSENIPPSNEQSNILANSTTLLSELLNIPSLSSCSSALLYLPPLTIANNNHNILNNNLINNNFNLENNLYSAYVSGIIYMHYVHILHKK